jgi:hypothetical protein
MITLFVPHCLYIYAPHWLTSFPDGKPLKFRQMSARVKFSKQVHTLFYISTFVLIFWSCGKEDYGSGGDGGSDCSGMYVTYSADIKPILDVSCAKSGCHDAITAQNGVDLSNYVTASVVSHEARFLAVINHQSGYPAMPKDGPKLPASQIQLLTCWVSAGSLP